MPLGEETPDHSSLTRLRDRLPLEVHQAVFRFVLQLAEQKGLLQDKTMAVDATTLEADAAMSRNLGLVMRSLFGIGTARSLQAASGLADSFQLALFNMQRVLRCLSTIRFVHLAPQNENTPIAPRFVPAI